MIQRKIVIFAFLRYTHFSSDFWTHKHCILLKIPYYIDHWYRTSRCNENINLWNIVFRRFRKSFALLPRGNFDRKIKIKWDNISFFLEISFYFFAKNSFCRFNRLEKNNWYHLSVNNRTVFLVPCCILA